MDASREAAAERLLERAEDVRREAKSLQRKTRVLTQLAASLEDAANDYIQTDRSARPPVK